MSRGDDVHPDGHLARRLVAEEQLAELRRRIEATRWPSRELVADRSQGVQLATMQALARYWTTEYDMRRVESRLNALPQFVTEIDGVDIDVIHVRSRHEDALPLIMTHGWPGSVIELLDTVGPLTDPTAHGGSAEDAFHLVLPSLPGYGFSGEPRELGWENGRIARASAELIHRLGYTRYVAQGGDVGNDVTDAMGRQGPDGLVGIHVTLLDGAIPIKDQLAAGTEQERAAHAASKGLALAVVAVAQLLIVLDGTIVNVALPSLESDLGISVANRSHVSVSTPPASRPTAPPAPETAPKTRARSRGSVKVTASSDSAEGARSAAEAPWRNRAANSTVGLGLTEKAANATSPIVRLRRRPM